MSAVKRVVVFAVTAALTLAAAAGAAGPITGKVRGVFVRNAYDGTLDQAGLKKYIRTPRSYVWCAWQDGKVLEAGRRVLGRDVGAGRG